MMEREFRHNMPMSRETLLICMRWGGEVSGPADVYVDSAQNVYISDSGNNRILCLDSAFKLQRVIESYTIDGKSQKLSDPNGLWVTDDGLVYVADTGNGLVVAIDKKDQAVRMMGNRIPRLLERI